MPVKATTPFQGMNSNTSVPPEMLTEKEKITRPGRMTPTDPLVMATMGRRRAGTVKATIQSPSNLKREHNLGNNVLEGSNMSSAT